MIRKRDFLSPQQIAPYINVDPACWSRTMRENAAAHPPFPIVISGRSVKIPKLPFIRAMKDWGIDVTELETATSNPDTDSEIDAYFGE